jgi:hypothetical protein
MKRERYQHPLNSSCLCGSGLKYKRCCYSDIDLFSNKMTEKMNEHLAAKNHKEALKFARLEITRYTILHKTNTAPFIYSKNDGVMRLLKIDIDALSSMIDGLLRCYQRTGCFDDFISDAERLRASINDPRWQRQITYYQILALLGDDWRHEVEKES